MEIFRNNKRRKVEWFLGKYGSFGGMLLKILDFILDFLFRVNRMK